MSVDASLSLHQRTVLLRLTVEQEAVIIAGVLVGIERGHVALCTWFDLLGAAGQDTVCLRADDPAVHDGGRPIQCKPHVHDGILMLSGEACFRLHRRHGCQR